VTLQTASPGIISFPSVLLLLCKARELQNVDCVEEAVAPQRGGATHAREGGRRVRRRSGFREGATMWSIACCESLAVRSTRSGVVGRCLKVNTRWRAFCDGPVANQ
jgi:hypothetical protein